MTDEERIKRLAEWMGWEVRNPHENRSWAASDDWWSTSWDNFIVKVRDWNPLTSLDHARMLEDEVERRGLLPLYTSILINKLYSDPRDITICLIRATPDQRCRAVEKLMEVEG